MIRWCSRCGLLIALIALCMTTAQAQQGGAPVDGNGQPVQEEDGTEPTATAQEGDSEPDAAEEENSDDAPVGDSPTRFIPTEQVSQDLGVSFPADI